MPEREDIEVHLATCPDCAGELAQYRGIFAAMASLRHDLEETPPGFAAGILAFVAAEQSGWAERAFRLAHDPKLHVAAASVGGVLVGAVAIGLILWRASRRGVARAA